MNRFIKDKPIAQTRVVVAMSGGVDSSVVAAMLADEGYEVIGITMQLYDHGEAIAKKSSCCAGQDIHDARLVAAQIGFPHYVLDYESLFRESVIEDFADSYMRGETPIPCIRCNQTVKFRDMFKVAKDLDADALATGHYVQRVEGKSGVEMHKGADHLKDQSYFLFATSKKQLEYLHFPLGGFTKDETRKLANKYNLDVADKPDSQDICFVPSGGYAKIVEKLRPHALDKGDIILVNGTKIGEHNGIINYTIGQRKGLGIAHPEPLYVVKILPDKKQVIVGTEKNLYNNEFTIKDINWIDGKTPHKGLNCMVKLRSGHNGAKANIIPFGESCANVILQNPEKAITKGQACVFYNGNHVLGGGWILEILQ